MAALEFRVVTTLDRKVTPAAGVVVLVGPLRGWNDYGYRCSFRI
jgi:hypothetical protein